MAAERVFPMVVLLLDRVRRVAVDEARHIIQAEQGEDAAASAEFSDCGVMQYFQWHFGETPHHIGTSSEPYLDTPRREVLSEETVTAGEINTTIWEQIPPQGEPERRAWLSHNAWMYVDALLFFPTHQLKIRLTCSMFFGSPVSL